MNKYEIVAEIDTADMAASEIDLESLGLAEMAYLKAAVVDEKPGFAIFAANGVAIGFAPERIKAVAAIMENDMALAPVH